MKYLTLSWDETHRLTLNILRQMQLENWRPDYVVGITRGGLVTANLISQYLDVRCETLKVSLRNDSRCDSNPEMAANAYAGVNILIVDDINDSGATLNWICDDWQGNVSVDASHWSQVWGKNVKIATLIDNESSSSKISVDYTGKMINKIEDPVWVEFPWEIWWKL